MAVTSSELLKILPLPPNRVAQVHEAGAEVSRRVADEWDTGRLRNIDAHKLAHGLGWFSIGLGLAQVLAPAFMGRMAGGEGKHTALIRLFGMREISHGLAIFSQGRRPAGAVWSRVAGDAMDLAVLGGMMFSSRTDKAGVAFAAANVMGVTALDVLCAQQLDRESGLTTRDGAIRMKRSIAIARPPSTVYAFWREYSNLPRFMYHLEAVQEIGPRLTHWTARAPAGGSVEWDAEHTEDRPNEMLAWQTLPGAMVWNRGSVHFEPRRGGTGTIVRVDLEYRPPGGRLGTLFAKLFNESPEQQIYDDLRRLKQVLETGEVVKSDGSPSGTGQVAQRPARPQA